MRRRGLLVLALALLVVPPAGAQTPLDPPSLTVIVDDPGGPLDPGEVNRVPIRVKYTPRAGHVPEQDPTSYDYNQTRPTRITLTVGEVPPWATPVGFEPAELLLEVRTGQTTEALAHALLDVAPDAPAGVRGNLTVAAHAQENGNIPAANATSTPTPVRPALVVNVTVAPLFDAAAPLPLSGGRWHDVPFRVTNHGNGLLVILLNVTAGPEAAQWDFPPRLDLGPKEAEDVHVRLRLPWTEAQEGILILEALPLTEDGEGSPVTAEVEVQGTSAAPGPAPGLLVAAVGLVALLAAGRR